MKYAADSSSRNVFFFFLHHTAIERSSPFCGLWSFGPSLFLIYVLYITSDDDDDSWLSPFLCHQTVRAFQLFIFLISCEMLLLTEILEISCTSRIKMFLQKKNSTHTHTHTAKVCVFFIFWYFFYFTSFGQGFFISPYRYPQEPERLIQAECSTRHSSWSRFFEIK